MAAVFSYAQAAKGLSSTQPSTKTPSTEPPKAEPTTDDADKISGSKSSSDVQSSETETSRETEKAPPKVNGDKESSVPTSKQNNSKPAAAGAYSPSVGTISTGKDDDSSSAPNGTSESTWDKQSQTSGTEKPGNGAENSKGKSDSTAEKSAPPKELKAAPLPIVNVWQQRREAQDAKVKAIETMKPAVAPAAKQQKPASSTPVTAGESQQVQQDQRKQISKKKGSDAEAGHVSGKDRKKSEGGGKGRDDGKPFFFSPFCATWFATQSAKLFSVESNLTRYVSSIVITSCRGPCLMADTTGCPG